MGLDIIYLTNTASYNRWSALFNAMQAFNETYNAFTHSQNWTVDAIDSFVQGNVVDYDPNNRRELDAYLTSLSWNQYGPLWIVKLSEFGEFLPDLVSAPASPASPVASESSPFVPEPLPPVVYSFFSNSHSTLEGHKYDYDAYGVTYELDGFVDSFGGGHDVAWSQFPAIGYVQVPIPAGYSGFSSYFGAGTPNVEHNRANANLGLVSSDGTVTNVKSTDNEDWVYYTYVGDLSGYTHVRIYEEDGNYISLTWTVTFTGQTTEPLIEAE